MALNIKALEDGGKLTDDIVCAYVNQLTERGNAAKQDKRYVPIDTSAVMDNGYQAPSLRTNVISQSMSVLVRVPARPQTICCCP